MLGLSEVLSSDGVPFHSMIPFLRNIILSPEIVAHSMSCMIEILVIFFVVFFEFWQSLMSWAILIDVIGSRPDVGSSKNIISGSQAKDLAKAARFCIPPDKSDGYRFATLGARPTSFSFDMAISIATFLDILLFKIRGRVIFFQIGNESKRALS